MVENVYITNVLDRKCPTTPNTTVGKCLGRGGGVNVHFPNIHIKYGNLNCNILRILN